MEGEDPPLKPGQVSKIAAKQVVFDSADISMGQVFLLTVRSFLLTWSLLVWSFLLTVGIRFGLLCLRWKSQFGLFYWSFLLMVPLFRKLGWSFLLTVPPP